MDKPVDLSTKIAAVYINEKIRKVKVSNVN